MPTYIGDSDTDAQFNAIDVGSLLSNLDISGNDLTDSANTQTIWDTSAGHVPQSAVEQGSGSGLDSDTVDGYQASELRNPKNIARLSSNDTSTDINQSSWVTIPWNVEYTVDSAYTHDATNSPGTITFDEAGTYRVMASVSYDSNGNIRINPGIKFNVNGTRKNTFGLTGYARSHSGHNEASNVAIRTIEVSAGDTLKVQTTQMANSGTVTMRSEESILEIEQLSVTSAVVSDADTLDGLDSTDFVQVNGNNPITGTQQFDTLKSDDADADGNAFYLTENGTSGDLILDSDNTANAFQFTDTGNLGIGTAPSYTLDVSGIINTSGDVLVGGNVSLTGGAQIDFSNGRALRGGSSYVNLYTPSSSGSKVGIYDDYNNQWLAEFHTGGNVDLNNGNLNVHGAGRFGGSGGYGQSYSTDSLRVAGHVNLEGSDVTDPVIRSPGNGGRSLRIYDDFNGQDITRFDEGGLVTIPNGSLHIGQSNRLEWADTSGDGNNAHITTDNNDRFYFVSGGNILRFRSSDNVDTIRLSESNHAYIPNGNFHLYGDGLKTIWGRNNDFSVYYENSSDELVLKDETNNVELIRQPKSGSTKFLQGIDAGTIEAPEDSFTQIINASNTSSTSSGTTVGYTLSVDNQTALEVKGTSDGSGGLSSGPLIELPDIGQDPSANGQFTNNAGDVKVYSGGSIVNLSNIGTSDPIVFNDSDGDGSQFSMTEDSSTGDLEIRHGGSPRHELAQNGDMRIEGSLTEGATL